MSAEAVFPGGVLGSYVLPDDLSHTFVSGQGCRVMTEDGLELIDHMGGAGALILGHSHPAVVAAVQRQAERAIHLFGVLNDRALVLAERLVAAIPCAERITFASTGSEATAYAMRLARAFTGRDLILKFEGGYHGNHDYALVSTFPAGRSDFPRGLPDTAGQPDSTRATVLVAPFNDLAAVDAILADHGANVAGIILECVQRIIPATEEFLVGLRTLADRHGVVLIFDEIVTGFRLGFDSAQGRYGVLPDLATFGKIVGAGGPMSCVVGRADIVDTADPHHRGEPGNAYLNGTHHGNPLAAAATLAVLEELETPHLYEELEETAEWFCREAQAVLDRHRVPAIAFNVGSLWQILFTDRPPRSHADIVASDVAAMRALDIELLRRGQLVIPGVRRFVSTAHGRDDLDATIDALDGACAAFKG
jgi:glutamate-1-semialdehyde 2,1-aminomutase